MTTSKTQITLLLAALSALAFYQIFVIPPAKELLHGFDTLRLTGLLPDGIPVRRVYTGHAAVDKMLVGLAGFFSAASDGKDISTYLFSLWFLPQLCGILIFVYWEAGKVNYSLVRLPTFFCMAAQLMTVGVVLPWYYISHILSVSASPSPYALPSDAVARAATLLPAIVVGYLAPSIALFFLPPSMTLDTRQIIAALWQPFPIYVAVAHTVFRYLYAAIYPAETRPSTAQANVALSALKRAYILAGLVSAIAHWVILVPSLSSKEPSTSFAHIFVPHIVHAYLPFQVDPLSNPAYRTAGRLLLQHDFLSLTAAAFIFFGWTRFAQARILGEPASFAFWLFRLLAVTLLGGPGAAYAVEAVGRENRLAKQTVVMKNSSGKVPSKEQ